MALPFFYTKAVSSSDNMILLDDENSRHIVQVLRMEVGRKINITDGNGTVCTTEIIEAHKKRCTVKITHILKQNLPVHKVCVAISPVKNSSRFEWFLEKATEMGVTEIVPLMCDRTEKQFLKFDRLRGILISAMLQSQQAWLPLLQEPIKFEKFVKENESNNKFIAHCEEQQKISLKEIIGKSPNEFTNQSTILIGPEGDFTKDEINFALQNNFTPVALGNTRLRTETAALVAATLLCVG
jgi:16S rRNA (uracil1498-N3)-methyltransferase